MAVPIERWPSSDAISVPSLTPKLAVETSLVDRFVSKARFFWQGVPCNLPSDLEHCGLVRWGRSGQLCSVSRVLNARRSQPNLRAFCRFCGFTGVREEKTTFHRESYATAKFLKENDTVFELQGCNRGTHCGLCQAERTCGGCYPAASGHRDEDPKLRQGDGHLCRRGRPGNDKKLFLSCSSERNEPRKRKRSLRVISPTSFPDDRSKIGTLPPSEAIIMSAIKPTVSSG
jgi:hypothetical protein